MKLVFIDNTESANNSQKDFAEVVLEKIKESSNNWGKGVEIECITKEVNKEVVDNFIKDILKGYNKENVLFVVDLCLDSHDSDENAGKDLADKLENEGYRVLRVSAKTDIDNTNYIFRALDNYAQLDLNRTTDDVERIAPWFNLKSKIAKEGDTIIKKLINSDIINNIYFGIIFYFLRELTKE